MIFFIQIAAQVNKGLDLYFPPGEHVNVIAEPGRYYVASAFMLAYRVHTRRDIRRDGKTIHSMYFLIDGTYGMLTPIDPKVFRPITMKPATDGINEQKITRNRNDHCVSLNCHFFPLI